MSLEVHSEIDFSGLRARVRAALPPGIDDGMEHIGEVSAQVCPIEEGTLLRSQETGVDEDKFRGWISYGTPYARKQHEDTELKHLNGKQSKYLENPLISEGPTAVRIVGQAVKKAM